MVTYDDEDVSLGLPLIVHANSLNQTAATVTLASFIERKYYDEYNFDYLKTNTPTEQTAQYSTIKKILIIFIQIYQENPLIKNIIYLLML